MTGDSEHNDTLRSTLFTETAEYRKSVGTFRLTADWITSAHQNINTAERARLFVYFGELDDHYKEFRDSGANLLGGLDQAIDTEEYAYVQNQIRSVGDKVVDLKIKRNELIPPAASTPTRTTGTGDRFTLAPSEFDRVRAQKLPDLPIPRFNGRPDAWISFLDQFDSVVDARTDLLPTHKMSYLMSALSDEPKRLVQHLRIESGNYTIARDLLKRRYHNTRILADTYLSQILSLPDIGSRLTGLRASFLNPLLTSYRCLERLELPVEQWSYILVHICLGKLPTDLRSRFERRYGDDQKNLPTFDQLINFLEEECRHHDNVGSTAVVDAPPSHSRAQPVVRPPRHFLVAESDSRPPKCPMCSSQSHYLRECRDFLNMSPRDRATFVKANGLCYRCLDKHLITSCARDYRCGTCRRLTHHTLLCFNDPRNPVYPTATPPAARTVSFRRSPELIRPISPHSRTGGGSRYYTASRASPRPSPPTSHRGSPPPCSARTWYRPPNRSPTRPISSPQRQYERSPTPTTSRDRRAASPCHSRPPYDVSNRESQQ